MKRAIYVILILVFAAAFAVSAFYVADYFLEGHQQKEKFEELSGIVKDAQAEATDPAATQAPQETKDPDATEYSFEMLPGYAELYEKNQDVVGWLRIEDTVIDYPVMQTPGRTDYYLDKDFYGEPSARGCLYVREECNVFAPSDNVTIYGHTMRDGSMFAYLHNYVDKETFDYNSLIFFDTLYESHVYKIFAVFKTTAALGEGFSYHQMEFAEGEEDFEAFIATCKDLALYETGETPAYGDKIICLSTCEYTAYEEHGRLVVAAYRIS